MPERLARERRILEELQADSTILQVTYDSAQADRFVLAFRGRLAGRPSLASEPRFVGEHLVEIRLPVTYPQTAPDIRFQSPIFHPNVSRGGFADLAELGTPWSPEWDLGIVCERLWDVCRLAAFDLKRPLNSSAADFLQHHCPWTLPTDTRPLRDASNTQCQNVVSYSQRDGQRPRLDPPRSFASAKIDSAKIDFGRAPAADTANGERVVPEVLFIDDDTPLPKWVAALQAKATPQGDQNLFYIGDE